MSDIHSDASTNQEELSPLQLIDQRRYWSNRVKLIPEGQRYLDDAIHRGYLDVRCPPGNQGHILRWAYVGHCGMKAVPTVIIAPGWRKHLAVVDLNLESVKKLWAEDIFCPELDIHEPALRQFMLLANDYALSSSRVLFKQVPKENACEVARQLLAFYTRQYQKQKEYPPIMIQKGHTYLTRNETRVTITQWGMNHLGEEAGEGYLEEHGSHAWNREGECLTLGEEWDLVQHIPDEGGE